jgi:transcriptional regulator NrdR family protein
MDQTKDYSLTYKPAKPVVIIKKDGTLEGFNVNKVVAAVSKSAYRALTEFTDKEMNYFCQKIVNFVDDSGKDQIPIADMHNIVENTLDEIKPIVAKSYRDYRNYKKDFVKMIECTTVNVIDCPFTAWDCVRDCYPRFAVDIPEHQNTALVRILEAVNRHNDIRMYADEFLFLSE